MLKQLPGSDSVFLAMETPDLHGHTGGLVILDPSEAPDFHLDKIVDLLIERLEIHAPEFLRKVCEVPFGLDRPYWVDDPDFTLDRHIHRIALPSPGTDRQLADLCGYLHSRKLERDRPLWEMWLIEGLMDGRVAVFAKTHHALMDGVSGAGLAKLMFDIEPSPPPSPTPIKTPERELLEAPTSSQMLRRAVFNLAGSPRAITDYVAANVTRAAKHLWAGRSIATDAPRLSFNENVGPERTLSWSSVPLDETKALAKRLGVKVNDVVLYLVSRSLERYLAAIGDQVPAKFVMNCPVSTRTGEENEELGNQVDWMYVTCPAGIGDPVEATRWIHESAIREKQTLEEVSIENAPVFADSVPPALVALGSRLAENIVTMLPASFNLVVSNVPGPPIPLYTAGAKVEALYPISVLMYDQPLNATVLSNVDRIDFGFVSDPSRIKDPWLMADGIVEAMEELLAAAGEAEQPADEPVESHGAADDDAADDILIEDTASDNDAAEDVLPVDEAANAA